jgi:malate dehydrogenase (quinone)
MPDTTIRSNTEVVLIGAGIMSATLGLILKELQPDIIEIFERLDMAAESSDAWNNAGTGHSAFVNSIILLRVRMELLIQRKQYR